MTEELRRLARGTGIVLLSCVAFAVVAGALSDRWWLLDLTTHFRVQVTALAALALLLALVARRGRLSLLAGVALALNLGSVAPVFVGAGAPPSGDVIRVGVVNLNVYNRDHEGVLAEVEARAPDVVAFLEYTAAWDTVLAESGLLPYRVVVPSESAFGIALYSARPLDGARVVGLAGGAGPAIYAETEVGGRALGLLAVHPFPPVSGRASAMRDRELAAAGSFVTDSVAVEALVMGDLNASRWSTGFRRLTAGSGLRSAGDGFGLLRTFPAAPAVLGIVIDHVLVPGTVGVEAVVRGADVGSDHFPVWVDLGWR